MIDLILLFRSLSFYTNYVDFRNLVEWYFFSPQNFQNVSLEMNYEGVPHTMIFKIDGWLRISLCAHMEYIRYFDLFHRKNRQIQKKNRKRPILLHTCATWSELPSYISPMTSCGSMVVDGSYKACAHGQETYIIV